MDQNTQRAKPRFPTVLVSVFLLLTLIVLTVSWVALMDRPSRPVIGQHKTLLSDDDKLIEYYALGKDSSPAVVLLPSFGRDAADFNELATALVNGGYRTIAINFPGVGATDLRLGEIKTGSLMDYADDVHAVIAQEVGEQRVHMVGHAFGNRVARNFASRYGSQLSGLVLLSAGDSPPPESISAAIGKALFRVASRENRADAIAQAFFAPGNPVPDYWIDGWYPLAGLAQAQAIRNSPVELWRHAGGHRFLVIQASEDAAAPGAGHTLKQALGPQVQLAELEDAGHAMLPERPDAVAALIMQYFEGCESSQNPAFSCTDSDLPLATATTLGNGESPDITTSPKNAFTDLPNEDIEWPQHGFDVSETRFSPLNNINRSNVQKLGLAWTFDDAGNRALEATPIVVDGVMYVSGHWNTVYALDARSGEMLWAYDPKVDRSRARYLCCDAVNRGVALGNGRVFIGTLDGRLIALNAASGELLWETLTVDLAQSYSITGAPRVIDNIVVIGNGGAEYGVRGFVSGYDVETGKQRWRFYTVPGNPDEGFESEIMATAATTWTGQWWQLGGGGTVWDHMAWDPELDLLYIGVGNGSPWNRRLRSPDGGDNLFLSSIVALRPQTGEYVWHYQVVPAETWDYTATQHMVLADIEWRGEPRQVLMQAPKSGFFLVLDRVTGELLSAEPFAKVTWASHYDMRTGRPVEVAGQDYAEGDAVVFPSSAGAHTWQPMAMNPDLGLMFIPKMDAPYRYVEPENFKVLPGWRNQGTNRSEVPFGNAAFNEALIDKVARGYLLAWDYQKAEPRWEVPLPTPWNGGVLATAGNLVFQGNGDNRIVAYDATTGSILWQSETQSPVLAAPITYRLDGEQYVTVAAGGGGAFGLMSGVKPKPRANVARFLTYKLNGELTLPPVPEAEPTPAPIALPEDANEASITQGGELYSQYCAYCHGMGAVSGGTLPDLRWLSEERHEVFEAIVLEGALSSAGMPYFGDLLTADDATSIQHYLISKGQTDYAFATSPPWLQRIKRWFYEISAQLLVWLMEGSAASA